MTDIDKLAEEYASWCSFNSGDEIYQITTCYKAGLRKGLELNAARVESAWPSEREYEIYLYEQFPVRTAKNCYHWLKAQLLEKHRQIGKHYDPLPSASSFKAGYQQAIEDMKAKWPQAQELAEAVNYDEHPVCHWLKKRVFGEEMK